MTSSDPAPAMKDERRQWLGLLARANRGELDTAWAAFGRTPAFQHLRPPETGLVMVRARAGGTGRPFNLGEMTVTRAVVRLTDDTAGYGYVAGRDRRRAERVAVFDALLQTASLHDRELIEAVLLRPVRQRLADEQIHSERRAAATRVEFFTLTREGGS